MDSCLTVFRGSHVSFLPDISNSTKNTSVRQKWLNHFLFTCQFAVGAYAALRATLERDGKPIGNMDMMIAAVAISTDSTLITSSERHFRHVPGLNIENWTR